jgi:hypothetical protein
MHSGGFAVTEVPRTLRNVENWMRESSAATRKPDEDSPKRSRLREERNVASSVLFHSILDQTGQRMSSFLSLNGPVSKSLSIAIDDVSGLSSSSKERTRWLSYVGSEGQRPGPFTL